MKSKHATRGVIPNASALATLGALHPAPDVRRMVFVVETGLGLNGSQLAIRYDVDASTITRWHSGKSQPRREHYLLLLTDYNAVVTGRTCADSLPPVACGARNSAFLGTTVDEALSQNNRGIKPPSSGGM